MSGLTIEQIKEAEYCICKEITFISEEQVEQKHWIEAYDLVRDIDEADIHYIAYSKQFKCKLWSGDKKLTEGLALKGYNAILNTHQLFDLRQSKSIL